VERARKNDPLPKAEEALRQRKWADDAFFKKTAKQCARDIEEAVEVLMNSELPDSATVLGLAMTL
jgi:TPP-dependent pyruvate/acetoin dehydrogenase alpha subunit